MNVDGSFSESTTTGGAGMVLRDHTGDVIVSACRFLSHCQSPLEAELEACWDDHVMVSSAMRGGDGLH